MKFSITQLLYAMVVMAFIAAIIGAGANGSPLAFGIGVSLCALPIYFGLFGLLYWSVNLFSGKPKSVTSRSPIESSTEAES